MTENAAQKSGPAYEHLWLEKLKWNEKPISRENQPKSKKENHNEENNEE